MMTLDIDEMDKMVYNEDRMILTRIEFATTLEKKFKSLAYVIDGLNKLKGSSS